MANFIPLTVGRFFKESFILRSRDGHLRRVYIKVVTKSLIQVRKSPIFPINTFLQWPKKDLDKLKELLRTECAVFRQKFIYFEAAGKVELLEVCYAKNL